MFLQPDDNLLLSGENVTGDTETFAHILGFTAELTVCSRKNKFEMDLDIKPRKKISTMTNDNLFFLFSKNWPD